LKISEAHGGDSSHQKKCGEGQDKASLLHQGVVSERRIAIPAGDRAPGKGFSSLSFSCGCS
jgi:hypothetical protein